MRERFKPLFELKGLNNRWRLAGVAIAIGALVLGVSLFEVNPVTAQDSSESPERGYDWGGSAAELKRNLETKVINGIIASSNRSANRLEDEEDDPVVRASPSPEFVRVQSKGDGQVSANPPPSKTPSVVDAATNKKQLESIPLESGKRKIEVVEKPGSEAADVSATAKNGAGEVKEADDDAGSTEINVKNAELESVIRIFSKKTKRNYILDERVKGRVSIFLPGKISPDESIRILDSVLALKGFTTVPIGDNLWKIVPSKEARQATIPTLTESTDKPSATMVTRLFPLKFVNSEDVKQVVTPLVTGDGLVQAYTGTNSLIIIDQEDNIERIISIIEALDVPYTDRDMTIIPIKYADATEIAQKLDEILGEKSASSQSSGGEPSTMDLIRARVREVAAARGLPSAVAPGEAGGGSSAAALAGATSATVAARARAPKIIPDQRTNSIIVIADEDMTARIRALISQLDSKVDKSGNRFYVYRCQHAKADELASVLGGLVSGSSGSSASRRSSSSSSSSRSGSQSSGMRSSSLSGGTSSQQSSSQNQVGSPSLFGSEGGRGQGTVSLGENVSITADPATNSLIISAGKSDYQKILSLLEKLDIKRRQVLVEAMLLEVGIDDTTSMGMEFLISGGGADGGIMAKSDYGGLASLLADPTKLSNFSVAAASSGSLTLGDDITIPSQTVLLSAAQQNSNVNVLSAPNVLATDNEQAEIIVGQNVPFLASTSTSETNLNNTFNQVDRQDVGITLRITPQISSNNFVTLKIFTEVSNVIIATLNSSLGPTTTKRASETTVITKDSQMVVIGGLMSDDVTQTDQGVPFLKDVPVFGALFRQSAEQRKRTNLLIFITPRIVKDQFDARDVTIEGRDEMERTIDAFSAYPPREDVLQHMAIDRVAESAQDIGQSEDGESGFKVRTDLGTIYVPPVANQPTESVLVEEAIQPSNSNPVEGSTAPMLPGEGANTDGKQEIGRAVAGSDKSNPVPARLPAQLSNAEASGESFIVLQLSEGSKPLFAEVGKQLPLAVDPKTGLSGLVVPSEIKMSGFNVGSAYSYNIDGKELSFEVVGRFASEEEAKQAFPGIGPDWHILSPYEVMSLSNRGAGNSPSMYSPWKQAR